MREERLLKIELRERSQMGLCFKWGQKRKENNIEVVDEAKSRVHSVGTKRRKGRQF